MKILAIAVFAILLGACSPPHFVTDAPPIPITTRTPDHFELPARFAFVRLVYGRAEAAGAEESVLWADLATRAASLGSFSPLITGDATIRYQIERSLIADARSQRFNYLLVVRMDPETATADVALLDVSSGGVMATAQAAAPMEGRNGFWGGQINNPTRLARSTLAIAKAAIPVVEDILRGAAKRQK